ncbi:MAG: zinc metalloprotease HtpX [Desulforhopalus sp.]
MKKNIVQQHKNANLRDTLILVTAITAIMFFLGWMLAGLYGILLAGLFCLAQLLVNPYYASPLVLKALRAQRLSPQVYPELFQIVLRVAKRAGLPRTPNLYCISSETMNGFVLGNEKNPSIVLTDSLLRKLNLEEIAGIIGHEVAHIRNRDLWLMNASNTVVRITHFLATTGTIMLLLFLPAMLIGEIRPALLSVLLIVYSPTICLFLQLALSRTREFEADRVAVELVGEVYGLVSALRKVEQNNEGLLRKLLITPWKIPRSSLLHTHPPTRERIGKLLSMTDFRGQQRQEPRGQRLPVTRMLSQLYHH